MMPYMMSLLVRTLLDIEAKVRRALEILSSAPCKVL